MVELLLSRHNDCSITASRIVRVVDHPRNVVVDVQNAATTASVEEEEEDGAGQGYRGDNEDCERIVVEAEDEAEDDGDDDESTHRQVDSDAILLLGGANGGRSRGRSRVEEDGLVVVL